MDGMTDIIANREPTDYTISFCTTEAFGWRAVLIGLTEATIDAGKIADIPKFFFRDGPSQPRSQEKQLRGGQWLYTNIDKAEQVKRVRILAGILEQPVSVTFVDGAVVAISTSWTDLGYDDCDGAYLIPCAKDYPRYRFRWTQDSFGYYELCLVHKVKDGKIALPIPGTYRMGVCPPTRLVKAAEARLIAAGAVLFA